MEEYVLSPRNDYLFKRLFGDEKDKDVLTAFLKTILDVPEDDYGELEILNPISNVEYEGDKINIVDVKLRTKSGQIVNIEIQRYHEKTFRERLIYQEAKLIKEQLWQGDHYNQLNKAVCIAITEFTFIDENDEYHNEYVLFDKRTDSTFSDIMKIHTLELAKLPDTDDGEPVLDWLKFLKSDKVIEMEEIAAKNEGVRKAVTRFKELTADETERMIAEAAEKQLRIKQGIREFAWDEGHDLGHKEGHEAGLKEGHEAGLREGQAEVAKRMKDKGFSNHDIADILGVSTEVFN
jgi:predicted transposase/invertase (TIGR01784 family)